MPALSSTMTEGKIVEWLKQPGDQVARGESVLVVESDKADMDVEAFQEGFLASVLLPAGSAAPVGETIGLIVESEEEIAAAAAISPAPSSSQKKPTEPQQPQAGAVVTPSPPASAPAPSSTSGGGRVVATPRARKLAAQLGVELQGLAGSGPHGRIQAKDVERAAGQPVSPQRLAEGGAHAVLASPGGQHGAGASPGAPPSPAPKPMMGQSFGSPGESVPFNTLQQAVNRNMLASLEVPCFRVGYSIGTDALEAFYRKLKPKGVTITALLAKATALTLARHPQVNATTNGEALIYPSQINIALAVALEDGGLVTPVLQAADTIDLYTLSRQWADLVARARRKQLKPEEYSTGTFTLSNLGMYGVDRFDAILPPGTGAILAVAASRPVVVASGDGSIAVRRQMQVNLTADHRVAYGTHGAAFLKDLAELVETNPEQLAF